MIDEKELQSLAQYEGHKPVVSFYIDTDLTRNTKDALKLMFRQTAKKLQEEHDSPEVASQLAAIERFLEFEYDWEARSVAVFTDGDSLWKTVPLPAPVDTHGYVGEEPYLRGLYDQMDHFAEYAVALVDRESVRLFSVAWGRIQSQTEAMGEELKRHKQGGWAAARYQRRVDHLALRNLKQAVELIDAFCEIQGCERLMLGGSQPVLAQVKELMPYALRAKLIGEFPIEMTAAPSEVLQRSHEVAVAAQKAEEDQLVSEAVTAARKGGPGAVGLDDTLWALREGRVRLLLIQEDAQASGYRCRECGFLTGSEVPRCPFCSSEQIQAVPDVINLAILQALKAGAEINIVRQNETLRQVGNVAALLRY